MKELKTSQLCIEWELLNKTKNPITNRKIKKNGPTYKLLEDVCKNTQVFFAQKKKPQEFNKIKNFDLFQTKDIECKKQCTRADAETQTRASDFGPPKPVQESTSDPYFSALSEVKENSVCAEFSEPESLQRAADNDHRDIRRLREQVENRFDDLKRFDLYRHRRVVRGERGRL